VAVISHTYTLTHTQIHLPSHSVAGARSFNLPLNLTLVALLDPRQSSTHIPFVSHSEHFYIGAWSCYPVLFYGFLVHEDECGITLNTSVKDPHFQRPSL
jgi:hypothetical protein